MSLPFARKSTRANSRRQLVRAGSIALTLLVASVWFVFLRPSALGGPATYVTVSGSSMLPALESGDLVVAFEQDSYSVGDVVVYRVPSADPGAGTQIVHRVVGRSPDAGYIVQGDNREGPDYWRPTPEEVVGKMQLRIPGVGTALVYMRTAVGMAFIAALTTILVALDSTSRPARKPERSPARRRPAQTRAVRMAHGPISPASSAWTRGLVIDARIPEANGSRAPWTQPRRALRAQRAPARPAD